MAYAVKRPGQGKAYAIYFIEEYRLDVRAVGILATPELKYSELFLFLSDVKRTAIPSKLND
jgi:hypothetical protein